MTILEGDIKLLASRVMDDVPEGGGGPTGTVIPYGGSNNIFRDITEADRAGGNVSVMQVHAAVMTDNAEPYMGANFILSMPPTDDNVAVTLAKCNLFARRTEIAQTIANYLIKGPEWSGYLLEDHVAGQRAVQILHRPGTPAPTIGRTLMLLYNEGKAGELIQYVRVTRTTTEDRTFTYVTPGGEYKDFQATVTQADLSDVLRYNFAGSPPDRTFGRNASKTLIRDTTVADAANYYGASPTVLLGAIGDTVVKVASIYSQIVPNSRTETISLDQRPAAQRTLTLATSPREIAVGAAPHSTRIKVGQENRGFSWVNILKPFPAPNTLVISYMALGVWYTVTDDGAGALAGAGAGTVNYANGTIALTLPVLPDVGSAIIFNWGEPSAYTNRRSQAGYRAPEFAWALPQAPIKPGSVVVSWTSGGSQRTATDNGTGGFSGAHASGEINYPTGKIFLRPSAMIDAGGEFKVDYRYSTTKTEHFTGFAVDAGGFAAITLAEAPAPRSISIDWVTVRNVSASSGVSDFVSQSSAATSPLYETRTVTTYEPVLPTPPSDVPPLPVPPAPGAATTLFTPSAVVTQTGVFNCSITTSAADGDGTYVWTLSSAGGSPPLSEAFAVTTGTLLVSGNVGYFSFQPLASLTQNKVFDLSIGKLEGPVLATRVCEVYYAPPAPTPPPAYLQYTYSSINGFSGQGMGHLMQLVTTADTATALYFTGPVPDGAYHWAVLADNGAASFVSIGGSFEVRDGSGGFWVTTVPDAPYAKFVVDVQKADGTTLVRTQQVQVMAVAPTTGWQPPPPTVVKVRDPVTTGQSMTSSGASPIAGMFAGGVDESGKTVFVAVPPTGSTQWGSTYNPPKDWTAVWSAAEIAAKTKRMVSDGGLSIDYRIWGA